MKSVIHGLVLPYEVAENQFLDKERQGLIEKGRKESGHKITNVFRRATHFVASLKKDDHDDDDRKK